MSAYIISQEISDKDEPTQPKENDTTVFSTKSGEEQKKEKDDGSLMKTLHEYEEFQKNNMQYGKKNPYKQKTDKLKNVKKQFARLLSAYNLENFEKIEAKEKRNSMLLTSRAAMWKEAEKHDGRFFQIKFTSSKKKSIIDHIINQINILVNYTKKDKKRRTYFASFMILLSILITLYSSFRNRILYTGDYVAMNNSKTILHNQSFTAPTNGTYDKLNQLLEYMQLEKESNKRGTILEFLEQWKKNIGKKKDSIIEKVRGDSGIGDGGGLNEDKIKETHRNVVVGSGKEEISRAVEESYIKSGEFKIVKKINEELKRKIYELEKKLVENTKEILFFKNNSLKEIEQLKQKMKEELYALEKKYDNYVKYDNKQTGAQKKNKDNLIDTIETKLSKNEIEIKESIASNVESTKKELLQIISDMQKKIEDVEKELIVKTNADHSSTYMKRREPKDRTPNEISREEIKYITDEEEATEKKKKFSFWEKKEVNLNDIQKDLTVIKNDVKKSIHFIDRIFPSFEEKIQKQIESKIKNYIDNYKKDVLTQFANTKLKSEENYKMLTKKQEKLQKELEKHINDQIHIHIKNVKEELKKIISANLDKKDSKYDRKELNEWSQLNLSAVEILQRKVDELYNEFILDYDQIDWALESLGAKIVYKMTSSPLNKNDWVEKFMNHIITFIPSEEIYGLVKPIGKDPSIILKPHNFPGECFSFKGQKGKITIHLPATIDVSSVSIQHVHEHISNNPSATPKYFTVYGIVDTNWPEYFETEDINYNDIKNISLYHCLHSIYGNLPPKDILEKWLKDGKHPTTIPLGDFYFDRKKRIANFVTKHCFPVKRVIFEFTENYGANYTCVYRVKVHGKRCIRKMR